MTFIKSFVFGFLILPLLTHLLFHSRNIDKPLISIQHQVRQDTIPANKGGHRYDNFTDWAIYRGDKKGSQYSELSQINAQNVHLLEPAWEYHHGNPERPGMYSNSIIIDGLLYFTTPRVNAVAIDAAT